MLKKIFLLILMLTILAGGSLSYGQTVQKLQGYCEDGGQTVTTDGRTSTTKVQRSYPSCTVTVYVSGTTTLATIYSDESSTPKANPFVADSTGAWFFYGAVGRYDTKFSGGGITTPYTKSGLWVVVPGGGGGGGVSGSGTTDRIPKWSSTSSISNSIIGQTGTSEIYLLNGRWNLKSTTQQVIEVANEGTTGTTQNYLAKLTGAPSTAIVTGTSDTSGILGIVVANAGTTGSAEIAVAGTFACTFDGGTTAGNYVVPSMTTAGQCSDGGSTPPAKQIIGRVLSTNGAAGTYDVLLFGPGGYSASGGTAQINPGTTNQLGYYAAAGTTISPLTLSSIDYRVSGGTLYSKFTRKAVNLIDYGADPTGSSSSDSAIASWLGLCTSGYEYYCYAPAGQYKYTTSYTGTINGLMLVGDGRNQTVFFTATANTPFLSLTTANYAVNFVIDGIGFQGAGKTSGSSGHCVYINDATSGTAQFLIQNSSFTNCGGKGVYIPKMFAGTFRNNLFDEIGDNMLEIEGGSATLVERNDFKTVAAGKAALRIYSGNSAVVNNNGIEPDSGSGAVWAIFGQSVAGGDGTDTYWRGTFNNNNVESFPSKGIIFRTNSGASQMNANSFISPTSGSVMAIQYESVAGTEQAVFGSTNSFSLQGTATWANSEPIHASGAVPFFVTGTNVITTFWHDTAAEQRTIPYAQGKLLAGTTKNPLYISELQSPAIYDSTMKGTLTGATDPSGFAARSSWQDGTAARPTRTWNSDQTSGFYWASGTGVSYAGTASALWNQHLALLPYGAGAGNTAELRFRELAANGTDYVGFKAPDSIATPKVWTLPSADGSAGQCLSTNGSGTLSFTACSGGGTITGSGASGQVTYWTGASTISGTNNHYWDNTNARLGINVSTTPATPLNVKADISNEALQVLSNNSAVKVDVSSDGTVGFVGTETNSPFEIWTNLTTRIRVDAAGTVGINQATPGAQLHVTSGAAGTIAGIVASAASPSVDIFDVRQNTTNVFQILSTGALSQQARPRTSGSATYFQVITPADTTLTAATEAIGAQFGGNSSAATVTRQFSTGGFTTQRENVFVHPTYSAVAATTITNAATVAITNAPAAGTNVTITNPFALQIQAGNLGLDASLSALVFGSDTYLKRYAASTVGFQNNSGTTYVAVGSGGVQTFLNGSPSFPSININSVWGMWVNGSSKGVLGPIGSTDYIVLNATGPTINGATIISAPVRNSGVASYLQVITPADTTLTASTESIGAQFGGNLSAASVTRQWSTGALTTQRENVFVAPTYSFVGASTLTTAATVAISGAPVAGTNATITNPLALWVQGGSSRFDVNGALSAPGVSAIGTWITGGTTTTTKPYVLVEPSGTTSAAWSTNGTGLGVNAASGFTGNVIDLQVNGSSKFSVSNSAVTVTPDMSVGKLTASNFINAFGNIFVSSTSNIQFNADAILRRAAAANLALGAADAASPVAQTISVQNVVAGTSNTAGVDWTRNASIGTGTGAGGKHIWRVAGAGSSGTAQNSLATVLQLTPAASAATGLEITSNAAGSGVTLTALSSGSNENIIINSKGSTSLISLVNGSTTALNVSTGGSIGVLIRNVGFYGWASGSINSSSITADSALGRAAAAVVQVNNGSTGAGTFSSAANTPAQITADQNNYAPGVGLFQRWSSDASRNVTGLAAGQAGQIAFIWNVGSFDIVLIHESASSTAANRFTNSGGADITLAANRCAFAQYDATSSRWRVVLL